MIASRVRTGGSGEGERSSAHLDDRLLVAAADLFARHGYAEISVDRIAAAAGAGKQSIYRRYPTKEDLFKASIQHQFLTPLSGMWETQLSAMAALGAEPGASHVEQLRRMCRNVLDFVLRPECAALYRLSIAEGWRFPEWTQLVLRGGASWEVLINRQLRRAHESGEIPAYDPDNTARVLVGLLTGWVLRQASTGGQTLDADERDRFFDCAWPLLMNGLNGARPALSR